MYSLRSTHLCQAAYKELLKISKFFVNKVPRRPRLQGTLHFTFNSDRLNLGDQVKMVFNQVRLPFFYTSNSRSALISAIRLIWQLQVPGCHSLYDSALLMKVSRFWANAALRPKTEFHRLSFGNKCVILYGG